MSLRPANIKGQYSDNLAKKRRTKFFVILHLIGILITIVIAGAIYLLFFVNIFDLRTTTFNGLQTLKSEQINQIISKRMEEKLFGYIPRKNNILFLNTDSIKRDLMAEFLVLKSVTSKRNFRHELVLNFEERAPIGVWCNNGSNCQYFDSDGNSWGEPIKSIGFLMASVDDLRDGIADSDIDKEFLTGFNLFLRDLKLLPFSLKEIIIPKESFRDFKVLTSTDYPIYFSLDSNINEQIKILNVFLNDKKGDSGFNPQYVDLRIDGRVYYK